MPYGIPDDELAMQQKEAEEDQALIELSKLSEEWTREAWKRYVNRTESLHQELPQSPLDPSQNPQKDLRYNRL